MKEWLQKKLISYCIRHLLNAPLPTDFLDIKGKNMWFVKGKQLNTDTIQRLKDDAETFNKSTIWKLLTEGSREIAYRKGLETSSNTNDIYGAKMLIYCVDTFKTILNNIKKF